MATITNGRVSPVHGMQRDNLYDYFLFQRQMGTEGNNLFHFSFQLLNCLLMISDICLKTLNGVVRSKMEFQCTPSMKSICEVHLDSYT